VHKKIQKVIVNNGSYSLVPDEDFIIDQKYQILNIADLCNECGNCTTFCPTSGRPFADKPNIALCEESFNSLEKGYFNREDHILYKENNVTYRLDTVQNGFVYSSPEFRVQLDENHTVTKVELTGQWKGNISLCHAMDMYIIKIALEHLIN
jgi:putative selenate reductase